MTFPITAAQLTGTFCEAVFYGMYLVTCAPCIRILFMTGSGREERWRRPGEIRWMMVIAGLLLFIVCTLSLAMGFSRDFRAFVQSENAEKALIADWTNVARVRTGLPVTEMIMLTQQSLFISQCWIVCARRWLVIVPSVILYLTNLAVSFREYAMMAAVRGVPNGTISANAGAFRSLLLAFFSTITAQNVLTTSILIWRIWQVEKSQTRMLGEQQRHLRRIMIVLMESGAAYTTLVFMTLISSAVHSNASYPISNMASGIIQFIEKYTS
ncbi:hypothetical protein AN958_08256 [Leucoagaricus sp. SymC.cos]|nr:hypothetical protein AN958_08256 [Leucoagaricus sp. SymC.cos]